MAKYPVRVGIVGVGQRGLQHLKVLWDLQDAGQVRITALCDAWEDNLTESKIRRFVPDYRGDGIAGFTKFDPIIMTVLIPPNNHRSQTGFGMLFRHRRAIIRWRKSITPSSRLSPIVIRRRSGAGSPER